LLTFWFVVAVQLYDINHGSRAGDVHRQNQLNADDWDHIGMLVAIGQPVAEFTNNIEGSKYPTGSIFMPMLGKCINTLRKDYITKPWDKASSYHVSALPTEIKEGRDAMTEGLVDRFVDNLDILVKEKFTCATLLDPRFKDWRFKGADLWYSKDEAISILKIKYTEYEPNGPEDDEQADGNKAPAATSALEDFLADSSEEEAQGGTTSYTTKTIKDELKHYLQDVDSVPLKTDVLTWWKAYQKTLPHLAHMARQYLGTPATSAGVERLFSKAGRMHADDKKGSSAEIIRYKLLFAKNYVMEPPVTRYHDKDK
jgi:hypothetical protein